MSLVEFYPPNFVATVRLPACPSEAEVEDAIAPVLRAQGEAGATWWQFVTVDVGVEVRGWTVIPRI